MAEYSTIPVSLRIIVLILIIIFLVILGFIVLSSFGIIDARGLLSPFYRLVGLRTETPIDAEDPLLLVHQRERKNKDALALWEEEISLKAKQLGDREGVVKQKEEILADKEKELRDAENSVKDDTKAFDDRRRRLEQKSETFRSMPPENAVKIMLEMDDQEVIQVLRVTEEIAVRNNELSIVPYWISLMPPERAAEIDRKWR